MSDYHTPVLLEETLVALQVQPGQWYVDATLGGGGHTQAILEAGGNVLGIDQDQDALDEVAKKLSPDISSGQLRLVKANFRDLHTTVEEQSLATVTGILIDLGVSSHQLDVADRGFSFNSDTLDMRMDASQPVTAAELLAKLPQQDLAQLFTDLGEERYANHFAKVIVHDRQQQPITSGRQLADLLVRVSPPAYRHGPIHPATRVFQSLRMAVNDELGSLSVALPQAISLLNSGGRLAVISFHSLEDRVVKQTLLQEPMVEVLTKKPITAGDQELAVNPRSRSAKLRVAEKV